MWISPLQATLQFPVHTNWVSCNLTQIPQVKGLVLEDSLPPLPLPHTSDDSCMVGPQVSPELLSVWVTTPFSDSVICQNGSQNSGKNSLLPRYWLITEVILRIQMSSQMKSDTGWGLEGSQAQGLQSLLVLWGCSASPTQKLCDSHTFGVFTEAFQKPPHWLRCGWEGLVMNKKRYSFGFRSSLSGTGTNTRHKFLITGPGVTRCFLATCVPPLTQVPDR